MRGEFCRAEQASRPLEQPLELKLERLRRSLSSGWCGGVVESAANQVCFEAQFLGANPITEFESAVEDVIGPKSDPL